MITAKNVTKRFEDFIALDNISCSIPKGCIYGLVGSNGAGKSTFLRLLTGVYKADRGTLEIDGQPVYDNPEGKSKFVFVSDDIYFLPQSNIKRMAKLYASYYPNFDYERLHDLVESFGLNEKKNLNTFSKGMKRQAATALALSCKTDYLFFDETFDGLDPVIRHKIKNIIFSDVCDREATAVITSHSLRELEDTCDQLTLLHKGGIVFESDVENLKTDQFKIQVAYDFEYDKSLFEGIELIEFSKTGKVSSFIVRGDKDKTVSLLKSKNPILLDVLPLSLEEVFIYEMEALGYSSEELKQSETSEQEVKK